MDDLKVKLDLTLHIASQTRSQIHLNEENGDKKAAVFP